MQKYELPYKPGTKFLYSNLGFGLLGHVVSLIGKKPFGELVVEIVCNALDMPDTRIELSDEQKERLATGYVNGRATEFARETSPAYLGAGGHYSTMHDMMNYLGYNLGFKDVAINSLLGMLHEPRKQLPKEGNWVGLAWQMNPLRKNSSIQFIWKDGATSGYTSYICWVKETKTGVVVIGNSSKGVDNTAVQIIRLLNPE